MVTILFQGPDFSDRNLRRNNKHLDEFTVTVDAFDLDYGVITINTDLDKGINLTLAVPARYMNESGDECGHIAWEIKPDRELYENLGPGEVSRLAAAEGAIFGRIIVLHDDPVKPTPDANLITKED